MLLLHTASLAYNGRDRLDVTRSRADVDGDKSVAAAFAPSGTLLSLWLPYKRAYRPGARKAWEQYVEAYADEMRASYQTRRKVWDALLSMEVATLVCFCDDPNRCHRTLLAQILGKLGAKVEGER